MSDATNRESPSTGTTWIAPVGFPVYGATRGAPVPDLETPWEFGPPEPVAPAAPPPPPEAYAPAPLAYAAPEAAPAVYTEHAAAPGADEEWLPSPLGPAETPEERARRLGVPLPQNPPGDQESPRQ